jgi:ornithine lipid hydroxylase
MNESAAMPSQTRDQNILPWLIYPATILLTLAVYFGANQLGASLLVSTYAAVFLGAALVTLFEWLLPERQEWSADRESVVSDFAFMVLVQMLLPKFLAFLAAVSLVRWLETANLALNGFWVHSWPVPAQALLMLLLADFFRYWLHVACHRSEFLWRMHSVHHSPEKLYWLNVGRFHPVEKAAQFFLDALPFILAGVGPEVLALYFVFYAVNGFFQHCNIRLRFGWLNYLISSAELHRWHHSRFIHESNSNYGNNVIIWDWLFGTRFLPGDRKVGELGLINREYPRDFLSQIKTPLVGGIDKRPMPVGTWREILLNLLFAVHMAWIRFRLLRPIVKAAREPALVQARVLRRILEDHGETRFGRERRFRELRTVDEFRRKVSVNTYDSLGSIWLCRVFRRLRAGVRVGLL